MRRSPNVVFVITDDQGYGDIGIHGNPWLQTPNLDRMARSSVQLDDHHHDPVCSPSRAALMTGQYATRSGVWEVTQGRHLLDPNAITMADRFAANGYRTAMFGKWHLGDSYPFVPEQRGFDHALYHKGGGVGELPDHWDNRYTDATYFENGRLWRSEGYCTDVFFNEALNFIEANRSDPFFVYLATNAMHSPFDVPEQYAQPYRDMGLPEDRAVFYGMIANFDENMGRLFARLQALGVAEDTIVLFTADHGTAAGFDPKTEQGYNAGMRGKKRSIYDGGHRVNFFIHHPKSLPQDLKLSFPTAHVDILPTLAELCHLNEGPQRPSDGMSLAPYIRGESLPPPNRQLFIHLQPDTPVKWHHSAVIENSWRLINGVELYDIAKDPGQRHDIAEHHGETSARLRTAYDQWWDDLQPQLTSSIAIPIGLPEEPSCELSARDWHPVAGGIPWMQEWIETLEGDCNGFWIVDFQQPGAYAFEMRRFPRGVDKPVLASTATLEIGDRVQSTTVGVGEASARVVVNVDQGKTRLMTRLYMPDRQADRGALYLYVERV